MKGDEIPAGARILAVVDYFDALTSERPYHKAMSTEGAVGLLRQEAGKALDPTLVEKFVDNLSKLEAEAESMSDSVRTLTVPSGASDKGRPAVGLLPEPSNKTVFDDIALAHREIYALYEIAQAMGTSLGVADTMALISSKLSNLVPFSCCALFLHNEEMETLRCRFATGVDAEVIQQISVKSGLGLTGWVARNRRTLVNARPSADLEAAGISTTTTLQSALVCPLVFNERFIGTLSVYHIDAGCYTEDHRRLLDRVCEQAAAVIYNSIVFEQTQEDSLTDPLTGLPNTRFMFMHLTRELARAERLKSEVSLLVMDLDNFKTINDSHGHHVGDRALREVAGVLRAAIRPYDICVRYAGDEFIVVLSGCGAEEAERKRVELQTAIDEVVFEAQARQAAAAGHQHRRRDVSARRQHVRDAAGHRRQPDVRRQDQAEAPNLANQLRAGVESRPDCGNLRPGAGTVRVGDCVGLRKAQDSRLRAQGSGLKASGFGLRASGLAYTRFMRIWLGTAAFAVAAFLSGGLFAQTPQAPQAPAADQKLSFEVASIKPHNPNERGGGWASKGGRQTIIGTTTLILIQSAFSLNQNEILSAPSWVGTDVLDVLTVSQGEPTSIQAQAMMRSLLEDRFALKAHLETRDVPDYRAVLSRKDGGLGPQLAKAVDCAAPNRATPCGMRFSGSDVMMSGKSIRYLLDFVESVVGRRIEDQTLLAGNFDLTLAWSRGPNDTQHPEIFTALQEQLGLKLESTRGPVKLLVIDSIQHPTPD